MSGEGLRVRREELQRETLNLPYAITSLIEELDAVDWRRQRADDCDDADLKAVPPHNALEEIEHGLMVLERIRRSDSEFDANLPEYLFSEGSIAGREASMDHGPSG